MPKCSCASVLFSLGLTMVSFSFYYTISSESVACLLARVSRGVQYMHLFSLARPLARSVSHAGMGLTARQSHQLALGLSAVPRTAPYVVAVGSATLSFGLTFSVASTSFNRLTRE